MKSVDITGFDEANPPLIFAHTYSSSKCDVDDVSVRLLIDTCSGCCMDERRKELEGIRRVPIKIHKRRMNQWNVMGIEKLRQW